MTAATPLTSDTSHTPSCVCQHFKTLQNANTQLADLNQEYDAMGGGQQQMGMGLGMGAEVRFNRQSFDQE